jgi:riboflavin synthase
VFTGLVEAVGVVTGLQRGEQEARITLASVTISSDLSIGDSISVNGACLTAVAAGEGRFTALAMAETLRRTALGQLAVGSRVNLERALRLGDRLGGHMVLGHVDGLGKVVNRTREGQAERLEIATTKELLSLVVPKGSIAVDGVSLTVAGLSTSSFWVALIPHTLGATTLEERRPGDLVNLETDIIGKYVARLLKPDGDTATVGPVLSEGFLREHGFA